MQTKIAYVTDIHLDETPEQLKVNTSKNLKTVLEDISARGIQHIIIGGDIGIPSTHEWFFDTVKDYKIDITLGNHDSFDAIMQHYKHETSSKEHELYYSYELGAYKLLFMDSSADELSETQLAWFKNEISTSKKIVVFIHHSILAVDAEVDKRFALKNRGKVLSSLKSLKKDVVIFSGHYHFNHEHTIENIHQYITPACSFQVAKIPDELQTNAATFGYRIIDLDTDAIKTELVVFKS